LGEATADDLCPTVRQGKAKSYEGAAKDLPRESQRRGCGVSATSAALEAGGMIGQFSGAISAMTPEQKRLFLRYGDHTLGCAERVWSAGFSTQTTASVRRGYVPPERPECDCGWLEALGAASGEEGSG